MHRFEQGAWDRQTDGRGVVLKKKWEKPETRLKLPQRVLGQSRGEKRFYCFLRMSERLSLQRLLNVNVVHSRRLIEKNGFAQWVGFDPLRQLRR